MDADAIVVGAGPGGAAAAMRLAQGGRHVLLIDRHRFPRDKSCGDGLTRFSTCVLAEMGILEHLPPAPPTYGARVFMRGRGCRDFRYPPHLAEPDHGVVVPRFILDEVICRQAVKAGTELREQTLVKRLRYDGNRVIGVEVERDGESTRLHAPVVIAADGAGSRLAYQAGLAGTPRHAAGYAIRGYYDQIEGLADLLEIYMPLLDVTDRYLLPSYGWVFRIGPTAANIGVGLVHRNRGANIRELFSRFLASLRQDSRFHDARPCGDWKAAPLRFDFAPERCVAPGLLLVGDAAGMISPFTGEGIGYALESGRLAAETVLTARQSSGKSELDLSRYPAELGRRFTGYFQTGRESARRYSLVWHVLESTFHNDRTIFSMCRRAALFPEGLGESFAADALPDVTSFLRRRGTEHTNENYWGQLRTDMLSVGEVLLDTVRHEWPFLAQMFAADRAAARLSFRPALLLLLAGYVGNPRRSLLVPVAAAVELGYVAAIAQVSVSEDQDSLRNETVELKVRRANWGNMFALMVSDFLLSRAYAATATVAPDVSREISASLAKACEGYVLALRNSYNLDLTPDEHLNILEMKKATLFELPCRLGAQLGGVSTRAAGALSSYGRSLGLAFQLIDDVHAAAGRASELGRATASEPREGIYSLPILYALQSDSRGAMKRELATLRSAHGSLEAVYALARKCGGFDKSLAVARGTVEQGRAALRGVPSGPPQEALSGLVDYVLSWAAEGCAEPAIC